MSSVANTANRKVKPTSPPPPAPPVVTRASINQPSTLQPFHRFSGRNGWLVYYDGRYDFYFTEGGTYSIQMTATQASHLNKQWWPPKKRGCATCSGIM